MFNSTNSKSRRAVKQKRDTCTMYDYGDNTGSKAEPEKSAKPGKKYLKAQKQADMRLHKEEIFCDFGDAWQKLTNLEKGPQGEDHMGFSIKDILDAQFYTDRSKR